MGYHLAHYLKDKGYKIAGTVRSESKAGQLKKEGIKAYAMQLPRDPVPEAFSQADVLIYTVPPRGSQEEAEDMVRYIIESAVQFNINKAIYISSTSVYPETNATVTEEDADYLQSRHTGIVIKKLEDLWRESPLQTTILRCGGLYGRERIPGSFLNSRPLTKPEKPVNMTHIVDVERAVEQIIEEDVFGQVFNLISVNGISRKDFYSRFRDDLEISNNGSSSYKIVSKEKIENQLGVQFNGPGEQ